MHIRLSKTQLERHKIICPMAMHDRILWRPTPQYSHWILRKKDKSHIENEHIGCLKCQ